MAGHQVVEVHVEEDVADERDEPVAHDVEERVAGIAVERPDAECGVGEPFSERREQRDEIGGVVLQVGVEDGGELAAGMGEGGTDGCALALVALVADEHRVLRPVERSQELTGAVGRAVVNDDQLRLEGEVRGEDAGNRGIDPLGLVVDRHEDGELRWHAGV